MRWPKVSFHLGNWVELADDLSDAVIGRIRARQRLPIRRYRPGTSRHGVPVPVRRRTRLISCHFRGRPGFFPTGGSDSSVAHLRVRQSSRPFALETMYLTGIVIRVDNNMPLTQEEFESIYSKVPRLTVEVIVRDSSGAIYLTQRSIEPCGGQWHLPGGTVRFGEALSDAVRRVAKKELSIDVQKADNRGYIEYPSHYRKFRDSPVGLVFEVTDYRGDIMVNNEASNSGWFTKLPTGMHADQDDFLLNKGYITR